MAVNFVLNPKYLCYITLQTVGNISQEHLGFGLRMTLFAETEISFTLKCPELFCSFGHISGSCPKEAKLCHIYVDGNLTVGIADSWES